MLKTKKELDTENYNTLIDTIKEKSGIKDFNLQVTNAFNTVKDKGKIHFSYNIRKKKEEEQEVWEKYLEENPRKHVGPQHYWKYPKVNPRKKPNQIKIPLEDDNGQKLYFMDRKITDKRVYKPMKNHIF